MTREEIYEKYISIVKAKLLINIEVKDWNRYKSFIDYLIKVDIKTTFERSTIITIIHTYFPNNYEEISSDLRSLLIIRIQILINQIHRDLNKN